MSANDSLNSAGHKIGQIIGDWWETKVIFPLLSDVANKLNLYLDNRVLSRTCRAEKVQWADSSNNIVDYDFVMEIGGSNSTKGIPVAFLESFWRKGARHSKDKARDDTNKLLPMREAYVTSRFLAIAACGEFTEPARDYVRSRNVELLFISKENIINSLVNLGINVDYSDSLSEREKQKIAKALENKFTIQKQADAANLLLNSIGKGAFSSFKSRIIGSLTSIPQEIRIYMVHKSPPVIFKTINEATEFLQKKQPSFSLDKGTEHYEYEVVFSDGSEFARSLHSLPDVQNTHAELSALVAHMKSVI
jgi:hypothetical protein